MIKSIKKLKKTVQARKELILGAGLLATSNYSFGAGIEKVNTIMSNVSTALHGAAIVTVTVAVFWAGYKIVFGGQTFREAAPILIGGIVIGSAAEIATMLVG